MLIENYIDGIWGSYEKNAYFQNVSPLTNERLDQFCESTLLDVETAIHAAKRAFQFWKNLSSIQRGQYLFKAATWLSEHVEEIAIDLMHEQGKSLTEATGEVNRSIQTLYFYAAEGYHMQGEVIPSANPSIFIYTKSVPLGVVSLITPWNFPIAIPTWKLAPALLYGNTVVLKPSEHAPKSAYYIIRAFEAADLPKGVLNCIFGTNAMLGEELVKHQDVKAISFTGSNEVGTKVQRLAAIHNKKVQLEMGGSNPLIVMEDADLTKAISYTIQDAFSNAGQKCTAASRILVQSSIYDIYKEKLIQQIRLLEKEESIEQRFFRPVTTKKQFEHLQKVITETSKHTTNLLTIPSEKANGYYVEPAVFEIDNVNQELIEQEIFGPVVILMKFDTLQEATELANTTFFGLSAAIFTQDMTIATKFIEGIEAGMVHINVGTVHTELQVPFGGTKYSSFGPKEQGTAAKAFFTETKVVYQST